MRLARLNCRGQSPASTESAHSRGTCCPKSPRVKCSFDSVGATLAATTAKLFMPEGLADVKSEICREICGASTTRLDFQGKLVCSFAFLEREGRREAATLQGVVRKSYR